MFDDRIDNFSSCHCRHCYVFRLWELSWSFNHYSCVENHFLSSHLFSIYENQRGGALNMISFGISIRDPRDFNSGPQGFQHVSDMINKYCRSLNIIKGMNILQYLFIISETCWNPWGPELKSLGSRIEIPGVPNWNPKRDLWFSYIENKCDDRKWYTTQL